MSAAAGSRARAALEILVGAAILLIPALANGYPFIFPDTGTYIVHAIERVGAADRPPYYSLLILPLHATVSLWPVAFAQACAAAASIRLAGWVIAEGFAGARYLGVVAALTAFSSLPWHAGQIVPDVFTGLIALWIFALAYGWERLSRAQRALLFLVIAGAGATHQSHLPLLLALFAAAAAVRLLQGYGLPDAGRVSALGAAAAALVAAAFLTYSLALVGRFTLSPHGSVFLLARMLADGTAREYLAETCPGSGNPFCAERERFTGDVAWFLWDPDGSVARLTVQLGPEPMRRAAGEVVSGVLATRPRQVALAAAANTLRQLGRFATLDTLCPPGCGVGSGVDSVVQRYFPREYPRMRDSRQMRGEWPIAAIRALDDVALAVSALVAALLLARALRRSDSAFVGLCALVLATLLANAFAAGALSGPTDRYQSRVIWLVPLTALLGLVRERARPRAATP
jgi:hypothetical protein